MSEPGLSRHPLVALTRARLKLMLREPEMVFWVFVFPILMALALGIAFENQAEEPLPVGVRLGDGDKDLIAQLERTGDLRPFVVPPEEELTVLRDGRAHIVVVPGSPPTYRLDPARPESRLTRLLVDRALQGAESLPVAMTEEVSTPGSRYIDWLVPGLLGMNIMGTGMWGMGFAVVVARSRKLLKRMVATPMRRSHFLASLVLSRLAFLGLEMLALLGFAWWMFGVPVEGALLDLFAVALIGALAFGGVGLLTSSRARTIEGVSGIMNVVMVPMWILSGVFFRLNKFSGCRAAGHSGPASDRADRRLARCHAERGWVARYRSRAHRAGRLGHTQFCLGPAGVSVAVTRWQTLGALHYSTPYGVAYEPPRVAWSSGQTMSMTRDQLMFLRVALTVGMAVAAVPLAYAQASPSSVDAAASIVVESPGMTAGRTMPRDYTPDGRNLSPPLSWSNLPEGTRELAVMCVDFGAGNPPPWVHWIIYGIPPTAPGLPEGLPIVSERAMPDEARGAVQGLNGWRRPYYRGPAPPSGTPHLYHFVVYALDKALGLV